MFFFQSSPGADPDFLKRGGKQRDPNPNLPSFLKVFRQNGDLPPPVDCAPCPVLYIIRYSTSQFYRKYYFGQEEKEMKLCLMILSVPWYMLNGLEHTGILSHFFNIHNRKQFQITAHPIFCRFNHVLDSGKIRKLYLNSVFVNNKHKLSGAFYRIYIVAQDTYTY